MGMEGEGQGWAAMRMPIRVGIEGTAEDAQQLHAKSEGTVNGTGRSFLLSCITGNPFCFHQDQAIQNPLSSWKDRI